jgi:hypothetical protein
MRGHPGDKYVAVDGEAGVRPAENAFGPLRVQKLLADKHRQDLAGKDLGETRVIDPRDLMEDVRTHCLRLAGQTACDLAAVNDKILSRDESRIVRSEKGEQRSHIFGLAQFVQLKLIFKSPPHFASWLPRKRISSIL